MVVHPLAAVPVPEPDVLRPAGQEARPLPRSLHSLHETVENLLLQVEPPDETSGLGSPSPRPAIEPAGPAAGQSERTEP